jgi:hypothetical protein
LTAEIQRLLLVKYADSYFFFALLNNHCRLNIPPQSFSSESMEKIAANRTEFRKLSALKFSSFEKLSALFDQSRPFAEI